MKRSHAISFVVCLALLVLAFPRVEVLHGAERVASPWLYVAMASAIVCVVSLLLLLKDMLRARAERKAVSELGASKGGESTPSLRTLYEGCSSEILHRIVYQPCSSKVAYGVARAVLEDREQNRCPCSGTCSCEHHFPPPTVACRRSSRSPTAALPYRKDEDLTDPIHRD